MGTRLIVFAAILAAAWGNHGHHGNHHSLHSSITHQQPLISSFSHKLPGTNSYMSVTRYFNSRPSVDDGQLLLHQENQSQRQGHAVQDNGFHPWNPRFQVKRLEATDEEWEEQLKEVFEESGLLGGQILRVVPKGLVNLNYDIHTCVHMGTEITPEESAYPPTAISYPGEGASEDKFHTLVLLDADLNEKLHWMVINIPGAKVHEGQIITAYSGPNPAAGSGLHRYITLVMEQESGKILDSSVVQKYKTESSCSGAEIRENFHFQTLREELNLSEPVAVNYFTQQYDSFVENINGHCLKNEAITPHPLYK